MLAGAKCRSFDCMDRAKRALHSAQDDVGGRESGIWEWQRRLALSPRSLFVPRQPVILSGVCRSPERQTKSKDLHLFVVTVVICAEARLSLLCFRMDEREYYTYIVASRTRVLYIGVTGNIGARVKQHREKRSPGFTADYNCNRLVLLERYSTPGAAIAREKQLKGWTRAKKLALIEKLNPTWIDLSEEWGKPVRLHSEAARDTKK
jgi:putative endonuclease